MQNLVENTPLNNYTLGKILRTGLSPLSAMIGISTYYGQLIGNPILGSVNALLFSKKLVIDIWNINQKPNAKTILLNSSKKILLGLGTIGLVNYSQFTNNIITPIETNSTSISPLTTSIPWSTFIADNTTTVDPWPAMLMASNKNNSDLFDWNTYISLNAYGIANLISGLTQLIPNRFKVVNKLANIATGGGLISSGVAMGINNDFANAYAIPTTIAGVSEIIHNLLPMETTHVNTEMQETPFTNEHARLINDSQGNYDTNSMNSIDSTTVIWDRSNPYQATTMRL